MRILSCHIENFGGLSDFSFNCNGNSTIICEENGWGKSTFAAFIRAMFYGLEGEKKKSLEKERKRYQPWQGGVFGGWLEFTTGTKEYRITRVFGEKEAKDVYELRDLSTNQISFDYSDKIGEELFHVNSESFMRTICIRQNDCATETTDDINARIGMLTDQTDDLNGYQKAIDLLTTEMNQLNPDRATGSIKKRDSLITELKQKVRDGESLEEAVSKHQELKRQEQNLLSQLQQNYEETLQLESAVTKLQSVNAQKKQWDDLKRDKERKRLEVENLAQSLPNPVPSLEVIDRYRDEYQQLETEKQLLDELALNEDEVKDYGALAMDFKEGVPEADQIEAHIYAIKEITKKQEAYDAYMLSDEDLSRLNALQDSFAGDIYTPDELLSMWNNRCSKQIGISSSKAALAALRLSAGQSKNDSDSRDKVFLVTGLILIVIGVVLGLWMHVPVCFVLCIAGAVLVVGTLVMQKSKKKDSGIDNSVQIEIQNLESAIIRDETEIKKTDRLLMDYAEKHHLSYDSHMDLELRNLSRQYQTLCDLGEKKRLSENLPDFSDLMLGIHNIQQFLQKYGVITPEKEILNSLNQLKNDRRTYLSLKERKDRLEQKSLDYKEQKQLLFRRLSEIQITQTEEFKQQLLNLRDLIVQYGEKYSIWEAASKQLADFEATMDLTEEELEKCQEYPSLEEIRDLMKHISEEQKETEYTIAKYDETIHGLEEQLDEWNEYKLILAETESLQQEEIKRYRCLLLAKNGLVSAREKLLKKYAGPLYESFQNYYQLVTKQDGSALRMDANVNVTIEELGMQRDIRLLSQGYQDLVGICLRFALADAMYPDEKPFLILDDPFVNLDDKKQNMVQPLLQQLSEVYQIIYFTCSESRGVSL